LKVCQQIAASLRKDNVSISENIRALKSCQSFLSDKSKFSTQLKDLHSCLYSDISADGGQIMMLELIEQLKNQNGKTLIIFSG
jgi:hypothetical protein